MPLNPTWPDIALRLVLTLLAGAVIGFNREARGHAAGLRTTMLVCLAASIAMVQANVLLTLSGKTQSSFADMDLMRLPLGILTGVGFIGGGAILRKGDLVTGVTTAATLWMVTVIGLCMGGGQLGLGVCATVLAVLTLWLLKRVDLAIPHERWARVTVIASADEDILPQFRRLVAQRHGQAYFDCQRQISGTTNVEYDFRICWRQRRRQDVSVDWLKLVRSHYNVKTFDLTSDEPA
ncbi:ATPase [Achromobacter aloeverae]|uniref:Protein MgtC n=2 Tax=Achromobacter aloeverae TaxID=1750518 RepID=A0A4Q1HQ32_9BURK|nr:MgtC/SapB family protein [Achromobacter aloeverae]RXN91674.1 ATPase [Achromobacter aloeverae]